MVWYALFVLGFGGANFAVYTIWLPEQYPTECRASAFAFATSFARFGGAGITFLVGAGVAHFGTIGTPVALTAIAFAAGLLLTPLGARNQRPPSPFLKSRTIDRSARQLSELLYHVPSRTFGVRRLCRRL